MKISAYLQKYDQTKLFDVTYYLDPERWKSCHEATAQLLNEDGWSDYIKYLDENGNISLMITTL